jgi:hypothetical protein
MQNLVLKTLREWFNLYLHTDRNSRMLKSNYSLSPSPRGLWISGALLAATFTVSACNPMELFESAEPAVTQPGPAEAKEQSASSAEAPLEQSSNIVADFTNYEGWSTHDGMAITQGLSGNGLSLQSMTGAVYGNPVPAKEGEFYTVSYAVVIPAESRVGEVVNYVAGPLYRNANGAILSWGEVKVAPGAGEVSDTAVFQAPAGAATVQLHLGGLWSAAEPYPTGSLTYTSASMVRSGP